MLFRGAVALLAIGVVLLALSRWRAETVTGRAVAGPILLGGAGFAVVIVAETMALAGSTGFAERWVAWEVGHWLTVVTASLIPVAFLVGLGQDRLARGRVADLVVGLHVASRPRDLSHLPRRSGSP